MTPAFQQQWNLKGHVFGTCMSKPNSDLMYINVPKNASSWTKPNLEELGWEFYNYHKDDIKDRHSIIVLRDPIDRWLSGICEYFTLYHPDANLDNVGKEFWDVVIDRVVFDDHTEKQVYFVEDLDFTNATFFMCDATYRIFLEQFLRARGIGNTYSRYAYRHTTEESDIRKKFKKYFKPLIENSKYCEHIKKYYAFDYDLISSVKFYGT
jgi:GNAT superfamily N-acetyltransferase